MTRLTLSLLFCVLFACTSSHSSERTDTGADTSADGGFDATPDSTVDGGPITGWNVCNVSDDCILQERACCDSCVELSLDQVDAINSRSSTDHRNAYCMEPNPICPGCAPHPNPNLLARCEAAQCVGRDVRSSPASECTTDTDCVIRLPDCCACGAGDYPNLVAVNPARGADIEALFCEAGGCALDCEPTAFPQYEAYCHSDGHCRLRDP